MQKVVASQYYEGASTTFGAATSSESITITEINGEPTNLYSSFWVTYGEYVTVSFSISGAMNNSVIVAIDTVSGKQLGSMSWGQYMSQNPGATTGTVSFTMPWLNTGGEVDLMLEDTTTGIYSKAAAVIYTVYPTRFANISYPNSGQWWSGQSETVSGTLQYESASGTWTGLTSQSVTLSYSGTSSGTVGTATTDSNGNFSFTFNAPSAGSYTYKLSYGGNVPSGAQAAALIESAVGNVASATEYAFNVVVLSTSSPPPPTPPTTPNVSLLLAAVGASLMVGGYGYSALKKS